MIYVFLNIMEQATLDELNGESGFMQPTPTYQDLGSIWFDDKEESWFENRQIQ